MTDSLTVRMIVAFMGLNATLIILGGIWLAHNEKSLTDALIALGGVALGNLGTFLVSSRQGAGSQRDAQVAVNADTNLVPVESHQ